MPSKKKTSKKKTSKKRSHPSRSRKRSPYRYNRKTKLLSEVSIRRRRKTRSIKRGSRRTRSTPRRSVRVQVSPRKIVDISAFSTVSKRSYVSKDGFQRVRGKRSVRNSARKYRLTTGGTPRSSLSSRVRRINSKRRT